MRGRRAYSLGRFRQKGWAVGEGMRVARFGRAQDAGGGNRPRGRRHDDGRRQLGNRCRWNGECRRAAAGPDAGTATRGVSIPGGVIRSGVFRGSMAAHRMPDGAGHDVPMPSMCSMHWAGLQRRRLDECCTEPERPERGEEAEGYARHGNRIYLETDKNIPTGQERGPIMESAPLT